MEDKKLDLVTFINKLVSEKREFEGLEPEVIIQIKSDLLVRVEDRINALIIEQMPEDSLPEFEALTETGSDEDLQAFCDEKIPDLAELIASELIVFRQTYLA